MGSRIVDERASLWSTLRLHRDGCSRFLLHAERLNEFQIGRTIQRVLEIEGRDPLAAGFDHVLGSVRDPYVAVGRDLADVAGSQPAVPQRVPGGVGVTEAALAAGFTAIGVDSATTMWSLQCLPTAGASTTGSTPSARSSSAGVMISASHNPFDDNGIKLFGPDGAKLSNETEMQIEALIDSDLGDRLAAPRAGLAPRPDTVAIASGAGALAEAKVTTPDDPYQRLGGRTGFHTEELGHLLAEMQHLYRSHPGASW